MIPLGVLGSARHAATGAGPVAGLSAWWKADALTLANNDPVASWVDSSGSGATATQANASYRPVFKTGVRNGLPVVRFDGTFAAKHHFATAASASTAAVTFTTALYLSSAYNNYATPLGSTSSGGWQIDLSVGDGMRFLRQYAASIGATGGGTTPMGAWYILTARYGAGAWKLRVNGATYSGSGSHTPSGGRTFVIGRNDGGPPPTDTGGNNWFGGDLCEALIYPTALSDGDIAANEAYLTTKWGF